MVRKMSRADFFSSMLCTCKAHTQLDVCACPVEEPSTGLAVQTQLLISGAAVAAVPQVRCVQAVIQLLNVRI